MLALSLTNNHSVIKFLSKIRSIPGSPRHHSASESEQYRLQDIIICQLDQKQYLCRLQLAYVVQICEQILTKYSCA